MVLKIFIIDDEAPARRELRYLLEQLDRIDIVGEAPNATLGLKGIRETRPHLVFLDIQMPGVNGLELSRFLAELPEKPVLVFATAFEEYALSAFEVEAFDYLLKPFSLERVKKTIDKVARVLQERQPAAEKREPADRAKKIILYKKDRIFPVSPEKIVFARAVEGDIWVHTLEGKYHTRSSLNELEHILAGSGFIRAHRSSLINADQVVEIISWFHSSYKLIMNDKERTEILVSRHKAKELKKHFHL
ncbi:MAG: response regulator transcription factor [Deltaproteobacteria bacterium]|nr:response regulator transcription factor [Deltaproteobacteria bacterium]MBI4795179.1 response regulator transcription factor [Deltaproteobacteria bacterium]